MMIERQKKIFFLLLKDKKRNTVKRKKSVFHQLFIRHHRFGMFDSYYTILSAD